MRTGWLLYDPIDVNRNRWFIGELMREANRYHIRLKLHTVTRESLPQQTVSPPDFVINRSRHAAWSDFWEANGVRCFNSAAVTRITNDKWLTYQSLGATIPMADTWLVEPDTPSKFPTLPLVAKPADGHGGTGVVWLADAAALQHTMQHMPKPFLLQAPMVPGWDMRVYVLGGEIYHAILRTSDTDFRSNFSLGGHSCAVQPDAEIAALVQAVLTVLPLDFAGVDILRSPDGGYVLGEIEDAAGCRMLYEQTDANPAADFLRHIAAERYDHH